ncbi:MAG: glycoside hydrolase family 127 protein [Armatimonadota bacterium]
MSPTSASLRRFFPVPFTDVRIDDAFWAPRLRTNREKSIPYVYEQCKDTGRIDAFRLNWKPGAEHQPHIFWDSDVAKWLEGACYSLTTHPDPTVAAMVEETVALIAAAQQPDGYLNTYYTTVEPEKRWTNLRDCHELYCAGHLIEAAVAHFQATGSRKLLDALCRYADYIDTVFGVEPGKQRGYCGHEEIELALVKLYHATGEERYLRLSRYFVEERGQQPYFFVEEARGRGEQPGYLMEELQAHAPVREQTTPVGHAVRAMYLYSAMADLAHELGDPTLLDACRRLWGEVIEKHLYLTGGIGSGIWGESFWGEYQLPNEQAYAETCAAIGLVFWSHRLLQFDCDGRYADVLEQALYNGVISGVSRDGMFFFYENPLASFGDQHRKPWYGCSCCPTNLVRLFASLGDYIYSTSDDGLAVHLYIQGEMEAALPTGGRITLRQQTDYPWDGQVRLALEPSTPGEFTLRLRVPGWCRGFRLHVNGQPAEAPRERGYLCIRRQWTAGDVVELALAMPVELVEPHPSVVYNTERVALRRGPLVFCIEEVDQEREARRVILPRQPELSCRFDPDLLGGVMIIEGEALMANDALWKTLAPQMIHLQPFRQPIAETMANDNIQGCLYRPTAPLEATPTRLLAIPYYAWDNRKSGDMLVWIPRL